MRAAKFVRVINSQRCEALCACGAIFTADRDEDGDVGDACCYDCSEAPSEEETEEMSHVSHITLGDSVEITMSNGDRFEFFVTASDDPRVPVEIWPNYYPASGPVS